MNGRERVIAAIQGRDVDRIPWVPFVGCHGASLIGVNASDYLRSENLLVQGAKEAITRYRPDGLPVAFDLQLEAEVLGCSLVWADETPPAVSTHPLASGTSLDTLKIPGPDDGRIKKVLGAARRLRADHPDIALYGLITGPFTLALHLLGTDIFMRMYESPEELDALMSFCTRVGTVMAGYYLDAGCDVIAVVDPMTSQIGPEQFVRFVTPFVSELFGHIREKQGLSSFFVCGQAQQNIGVMCDCRPDNISIDENIPLDFVRQTCLERGISFGGNLQLTVVLLLGSETDAQRHALEVMDIGGEKGFILAPGCDLPFATPPRNLEAIARLLDDPYERDVVRTLGATATAVDVLDMSQYGNADKVMVDIITLDSEACAPCQYMVEAVRKVTPEFEGIVEYREHKIKYRGALVFMASLMVKNIPTICIDGHITFVSRIPRKEELIAAIQKRIVEKLSFKIRRKRAVIRVLGKNEQECAGARSGIDQAIHELGADVAVEIVTNPEEIASYGILRTPAVVVVRYQVKAEGSIPPHVAVKEWIREMV